MKMAGEADTIPIAGPNPGPVTHLRVAATAHYLLELSPAAELPVGDVVLSAYSESFQEGLGVAQEESTKFYERAGVEVPELDGVLEEDGAQRLRRAFALMSYYGLEPDVVVSREGLDLRTWRQCFSRLTDAIHAPVIISGDMGPGVSPSVEAAWDDLSAELAWTVGVVAGAREMPYTLSHDLRQLTRILSEPQIQAIGDGYPTLAEYLTMQAVRFQTEREPVDLRGLSWIRGEVESGVKAPLGRALAPIESAAVTCADPEVQSTNVYVRPAARELVASV